MNVGSGFNLMIDLQIRGMNITKTPMIERGIGEPPRIK